MFDILTSLATANWMKILIVSGLLASIAVLALAIILLLSNLGAYFTKIAQGTIVFFSVGSSLRDILPNIGGYRMSKDQDLDGRHWLIAEADEEKRLDAFFHNAQKGTVWFQKWLWKKFGVKFISLFWPHTNVHSFDIRKGGRRRIAARTEIGADAPLRSRVVDSPESEKGGTVVDSLLFMVPRPVYVEGIELAGDNSRINLLLLPVFRQVIPALPVYYLKGDFFTLLDAAVEAAMVDFFARHRVAVYKDGEKKGQFAADSYDSSKQEHEGSPLTYSHWLKLTKAGEGSPMEQQLRHLNVSKEYLAKLKEGGEATELTSYIERHLIAGEPVDMPGGSISGMIPNGIVPRFGFALVSFRVVEWEVHKSTVALADSLLKKETELHTADGVRQKALGERDAILERATAESSRYVQLVNALVSKGVHPDVAAQVMATQLRTENIRGSNITTYVEGGGSATIMVPTSTASQT